jgi:hypothetical protein
VAADGSGQGRRQDGEEYGERVRAMRKELEIRLEAIDGQ